VAALAELAAPTIGLITNAGAEHWKASGTLEGAARAEGEMVEALPAAGTAVINADDPYAPLWRGLTRAKVVDFGMKRKALPGARKICTARWIRRASRRASRS